MCISLVVACAGVECFCVCVCVCLCVSVMLKIIVSKYMTDACNNYRVNRARSC